MPARIIVGGPADFSRTMVQACQDSGLLAAGVAVSAGDLAEQIAPAGAVGVIAPAGDGWLEILTAMASGLSNVVFFVAGNVTREQRDRLVESRVLLLPSDPRRAVRGVVMALERIGPAGFHRGADRVVVNGPDSVTVLRPAMVLFYSRKGGVGKTTCAVNAAAMAGIWARNLPKTGPDLTVAVLDNNPDGNLAQYFGRPLFQRPRDRGRPASFADLTPAASREAVVACLEYHSPTNVFWAVAPGAGVNPEALTVCLTLLARHFHFVFVDLGVRMDEYAACAAASATDVVLVADTDPGTVSLLYGQREEMAGFFGGLAKIKLAVNHRDPRGGLSARRAAGLLALPLAAELPYCEGMGKAQGVPLVLRDPRGKYAGEVLRLTRRILGTDAVGPEQGKRSRAGFGLRRLLG